MEYTDYLLAKLVLFAIAAFIYGLIRGFNGLPLSREQRDTKPVQRQD
jgi:hypothetical protein